MAGLSMQGFTLSAQPARRASQAKGLDHGGSLLDSEHDSNATADS